MPRAFIFVEYRVCWVTEQLQINMACYGYAAAIVVLLIMIANLYSRRSGFEISGAGVPIRTTRATYAYDEPGVLAYVYFISDQPGGDRVGIPITGLWQMSDQDLRELYVFATRRKYDSIGVATSRWNLSQGEIDEIFVLLMVLQGVSNDAIVGAYMNATGARPLVSIDAIRSTVKYKLGV